MAVAVALANEIQARERGRSAAEIKSELDASVSELLTELSRSPSRLDLT